MLAVGRIDALVDLGGQHLEHGPTSARSTQLLKAWVTPRAMSPPKSGLSG
jgi:hypothetical protein